MNVMTRTLSSNYTSTSLMVINLPKLECFSVFHILLSVYIIFQNSLIIFHYHKDWKKISSLFFILIAAADIGYALSELGRDTIELMCFKNNNMRVNLRAGILLIFTGSLFNVISVFLGLTLTVVKTIIILCIHFID